MARWSKPFRARWARRSVSRRRAGRNRPRPSRRDHAHPEGLQFPGDARLDGNRPRAGRRLRPDHAVELADQPDHLQGRARARRRLHDGAEAQRSGADERAICLPRSCTKRAFRRACSISSMATGPTVGEAMSSHPGHRHDVVHRLDPRRHRGREGGADTVKRVAQELGGKSANIILDDADLQKAVSQGRDELLQQFRPILQRADAHVRAARQAGSGDRDRQGAPRKSRSAIRSRKARPWARSSAKCSSTRSRG
jgi:hypothetical protein